MFHQMDVHESFLASVGRRRPWLVLGLAVGCGGELSVDDRPGKGTEAVTPGADLPEDDPEPEPDDDPEDSGEPEDTGGDDTGEAPVVWTVFDIQQGHVPAETRLTLGPLIATGPSAPFGFFLQDPLGGPYSGIWVYTGYLDGGWRPPVEGERVTITGDVGEYTTVVDGSQTQLVLRAGADLVFGERGALPSPVVVPIAELSDPETAERWEGVLVEVQDVRVSAVELGYDEFELEGGLRVDDLLYQAEVALGDTYTSIIGPLYYGYGQHKLLPRWVADVRGRERHCTSADKCAEDLVVGDLVITELMLDPRVGSDSANEWFELVNLSGGSVDLQGLVLEDADGGAKTITASVVVPADAFVVLGAGSGGSWAYGFTPAWFYGSLAFNNSGDLLRVVANGEDGRLVLDETVDFSTVSVSTGASAQLDVGSTTTVANDRSTSWCAGTAPIGTSGDFGTPGAVNQSCR